MNSFEDQQPQLSQEEKESKRPYPEMQVDLDNKAIDTMAKNLKRTKEGNPFELTQVGDEYVLRVLEPDGIESIIQIPLDDPDAKNAISLKILSPLPMDEYSGAEKLGRPEGI